MDREKLRESYSNTSYLIDAPGAPLAIRVGHRNDALDTLLVKFGEEEWAFITAYNPRSEQMPAEENIDRHSELVERVRALGLQSFPSRGVDDDGTWPTERGLLILGIDRDEARRLGAELAQNAILAGRRGGVPELVFCLD